VAGSDVARPGPEQSDMAPHNRRPRLASACTVLALALTFGGCGGSSHVAPAASRSGDNSAVNSSAAEAELVGNADAICKRVDAVLVTSGRGSHDLPAIARSASRNAALERAALAELDKLKPPASLARDWGQIIAYRRTLARELIELGRDAKANDRRGVQALAVTKKRIHDKLFALATRDGFKYCSQVSADTDHAAAAVPSGH
jgi:hypothetical protein